MTAAAEVRQLPAARPTPRDKLIELVKQASPKTSDAREIAIAVLNALDPEDYVGALGVCLPSWIDYCFTTAKPRSTTPVRNTPTTADRVRSWYAQQLDRTIVVSDGNYKALRFCSPTDLHTAAALRHRQAARLEADGNMWARVAFYMEDAQLNVASEIPEHALRELLVST